MNDVAELIADMARAGVDPDLIGRTAALLAAREPVVLADQQAERRREKDRERKRLRNSAESAESAPHPPSLDKESTPTPPKEIKPTPLTPQTTLQNAGAGDLGRLSERLVEAVDGKIQPHAALVVGPILELLANGVDLETDVIPVLKARAAKMTRPAGSWGYFLEAIREAHARRIEAGRGVVKPPSVEASEKRWQARLTLARQKGEWSTAEWGPCPGTAGCLVPQQLLQPTDGQGWNEWSKEAA